MSLQTKTHSSWKKHVWKQRSWKRLPRVPVPLFQKSVPRRARFRRYHPFCWTRPLDARADLLITRKGPPLLFSLSPEIKLQSRVSRNSGGEERRGWMIWPPSTPINAIGVSITCLIYSTSLSRQVFTQSPGLVYPRRHLSSATKWMTSPCSRIRYHPGLKDGEWRPGLAWIVASHRRTS